jgi:formylmethanofuran dehydrogenase subunit E
MQQHQHHHHGKRIHYPATFDECVEFHGHSCPGLAIGYRVAVAAMEALGVFRPEDEELVAICETDACGVDAIQVVAGTTAGKGNLFIRDYGKHAFTFINRKNGRAVRVTTKERIEPDRDAFQALRAKVFGGSATAAEEEKFHEMMHEKMHQLLDAPVDELLDVKDVTVEIPQKARIFATITCECCGEPVADAKTRVVEGKRICIPCAEKQPAQ